MSDGDADTGDGHADTSDGSARWRCAWCEKPHEDNDPPCDNCGHHKFERAVVPVAPQNSGHEREPVWVCPECGRQHQKNSPPCSRCGNPSLDKKIPSEDDYADELGGTSYVELLEPQYVAGFVLALAAGAVLVLALLGVISLPGVDGGVPGDSSSLHGVSLAETESSFVTELDARREASGLSTYDRRDGLDAGAEFFNRRVVRRQYGDGEIPSRERVSEEVGGACDGTPFEISVLRRSFEGADDPAFASPEALASALVDRYERLDETFHSPDRDRVGVDVHAGPDDRLFVTVIVC